MSEEHWDYSRLLTKEEGKDARKLVTLMNDGLVWVGIRAWHHIEKRWYNGHEPELNQVLAWMDLPDPAKKRWVRGQLI